MLTLDDWKGQFGDDYHERNIASPQGLRAFFRKIVGDLEPGVAFEPGCGRGGNLSALQWLGWRVLGLEPNLSARLEGAGLPIFDGDLWDLRKFAYHAFDLVLSAGLLCHLDHEIAVEAINGLIYLAREHLLLIEYDWHTEVAVPYRGATIWKRPYAEWLGDTYELRGTGPAGTEFPGATWWLFAAS